MYIIYYVSLNLPFVSSRTANWKYVFQIITSCSKIESASLFHLFNRPVLNSSALKSSWFWGILFLFWWTWRWGWWGGREGGWGGRISNKRLAIRYHWISAGTFFEWIISFPLRRIQIFFLPFFLSLSLSLSLSFSLHFDSNFHFFFPFFFRFWGGAGETEVVSRQEISAGSVVTIAGLNEKPDRPSKLFKCCCNKLRRC